MHIIILKPRKRYRVRLEVRYAGQWIKVGAARTNRRGSATVALPNASSGKTIVRAVATIDRSPVTSGTKTVNVEAPLPPQAPTGLTTLPVATPGSLTAGEVLKAGEQLVSANKTYKLVLQGDGNLVIYQDKVGAIWASRTVGSGADRLAMQGDGNLVMYQGRAARWNTATHGTGARALKMQDDGNLVLYAGTRAVWSTFGGYIGDRLGRGQTLYPNERLWSVGHVHSLVLQGDGNLVLYEGTTARWNSQTVGSGASRLILQGDGNLVLYTAGGVAKWNSQTAGKPADRLVMQADRNLVLYAGPGAVWNTQTVVPSGNGVAGGTDDYPAGLRAPVGISSVTDPWRFYNRQCTSFVAWRMNKDNKVSFSNGMTGPNGRAGWFGNAGTWHNNAAAIGYSVNGTPARGAIAEWPGHVGWVQQVNPDGSIVIEEYNVGWQGNYRKRTIARSGDWPTWFIHVRDF